MLWRRRCHVNRILFNHRQPFLPDFVEFHGGFHVAQAVFGNLAEFLFGHQRGHVHAGHARALGRFDAEGLAVKIQVEPPRRAVAPAHAIKRELLREVAMRLGGVTIAEPILLRDGHVQNGRAQINERHVEAASVEGDDGIVFFRRVPELREQFGLVRAGNEFHPAFARLRRGSRRFVFKIVGNVNGLAAQGFGIEHGDADNLRRERPERHEAGDFVALGRFTNFIGNLFGFAEEIFLLRLVEVVERLRGGFDVENEGCHATVVKQSNRLGNQIVIGVTDDFNRGKIANRQFSRNINATVNVRRVGFAAAN